MALATHLGARNSILVGGIGLALAAVFVFFTFLNSQADAAGAVVVRGIVKTTDANEVGVYITNVTTAPDASAIRGRRLEVDTGSAKKFVWKPIKSVLTKVRTASNPATEQEVVVWGTIDGDRIKATTMVTNYRKFTIEGTVEGVDLDSGSSDEGYLTINVTSSKLTGVIPTRVFKASLKGTEFRFRVDDNTAITALGSSKHLDEVDSGQQKVRVEGELVGENSWNLTKVNEL